MCVWGGEGGGKLSWGERNPFWRKLSIRPWLLHGCAWLSWYPAGTLHNLRNHLNLSYACNAIENFISHAMQECLLSFIFGQKLLCASVCPSRSQCVKHKPKAHNYCKTSLFSQFRDFYRQTLLDCDKKGHSNVFVQLENNSIYRGGGDQFGRLNL